MHYGILISLSLEGEGQGEGGFTPALIPARAPIPGYPLSRAPSTRRHSRSVSS